MAEGALTEDQQIRMAYHEMVAKTAVTMQRSTALEERNKHQSQKIQELTAKQNEVTENFNGYQKQTKEEKEKSDAKQIDLERNIRELEAKMDDM